MEEEKKEGRERERKERKRKEKKKKEIPQTGFLILSQNIPQRII